MSFLAAGHDTTAALMAWAVYYLTLNPEVERRMVEEILTVLGPPSSEADGSAVGPSAEQLSQLKYTTAVIKETLRLRPPLGLLGRWAPEGTVLGGYDANGKVVVVAPYIQQTSEKTWGPDALEWRPERWMDPAGGADSVHPYAYMPFSRGPRDCIGARFAMLEAKTILAMVYQRFCLTYAGDSPETPHFSVTIYPSKGVPVRVTRRR